jgi:16S rRNA (guanine(966)-N(2))-methyltransferase RsmD
MRVVGGEFRSRRLKTLAGLATRPTPERLRQALFDVLAPRITGTVFLDAYAGTGAVGIEALSRGAARSIFLERSRAAMAVIRDNLRALGIEDRARIIPGSVLLMAAAQRPDIAFLDPPYDMESQYAAVLERLRAPLVIAQHWARFDPGDEHGVLRRTRLLKQGDNALSFYESRQP